MAARKLTWDLNSNYLFNRIYNIRGTVDGFFPFSTFFVFKNYVTNNTNQVAIGATNQDTSANLAAFLNVKIAEGFYQDVISCTPVGSTIEIVFGTSTLSATDVIIITSQEIFLPIYTVNDFVPPIPIVSTPTIIDNASKILFCNSPVFINETATADTNRIEVKLFIWSGNISPLPLQPIIFLKKEKVSLNDNYISVQIQDYIKPFINPKFAYNRISAPSITNQAVFVQAEIKTINNNNTFTKRVTDTFLATLGYRWNYEQNLLGSNGVQNYGANGFVDPVNKWYNPKIANYFYQDFDFTKTLLNATSTNIIRYNALTPPANWLRCTQDPYLIVFINKLGLWETFTPHGKTTVTAKVNRTDANISHRNPSQVDNTFTHSRKVNSIEVTQSYAINTGSLDETMTSIIEEVVYSPLVYLIKFKGDTEDVTTIGLTIDTTVVSIDNTNITIDSITIAVENLGYFKTHQQIPVIVADEDFNRKTRLNNKNAIDYTIKFDETNNKINSIR